MKLTPAIQKVINHNDNTVLSFEEVTECCDSYVAVLKPSQVDKWLSQFDSAADPDFTDFASGTFVFEVDDKLLTIVSDSGGESATGAFCEFCVDHNIPYQFVIDGLDCEGIGVEDIYTGEYENNMELLELLHKIYN